MYGKRVDRQPVTAYGDPVEPARHRGGRREWKSVRGCITRTLRPPRNGTGARTACSPCGCPTCTRSAGTRSRRACSSSASRRGRWCRDAAGIAVVYFLMHLSGRAGQQLGIPYPVLARGPSGSSARTCAALIRGGRRDRLVRRADLLREQGPAGADARLLARPGGAHHRPASSASRPSAGSASSRMWFIQRPDLPARHGDDPPVHRISAGPVVYVVMFALMVWILARPGFRISLNLSSTSLSTG